MITQFRRKLKSKTARNIILWIIFFVMGAGLISTVFLKVSRFGKRISSGGGIATINDSDISYNYFRMKVNENEQQIQLLKRYFGKEAEKFLKQMEFGSDPRVAAIKTVVAQELFDQAVEKMGIKLSSDYVEKNFYNKDFLQREFPLINFDELLDQNGVIDSRLLNSALRMVAGITISEFEELALNSLKRDVVSSIAIESGFIPEFELKQEYIDKNLSKKYYILKFDFNSFMDQVKKEPVSETELKNFFDYENNRSKRYFIAEKRAGLAYYFDANSYGILVQEDEIKRYYDDKKAELFVKEPARIQVRRILIKDGADAQSKAIQTHSKIIQAPLEFANIAKEVSEDKNSAKDGGLMPMFSRGKMDANLEATAFFLKEDGQISDVIKTKDGFEIVQRVARQEAVYKPMTEVVGQIKSELATSQFKKNFSSDMNTFNFDEAKFADLVKRAVKQEKVDLRIKADDNISSALFRIRDNEPAYFVEKGVGVIVKLDNVQAGHTPDLKAIEDTVKGDFYEKKASDVMDKELKQAVKQAKDTDMQSLEKSYSGKYRVQLLDTGFVMPTDVEKNNEFTAKGFPTEKIYELEVLGSANYYRASKDVTSNGFIAKLHEIEKFDNKKYEEKRASVKKELIKNKKSAQLEEYIAFLRKKATIKVNK